MAVMLWFRKQKKKELAKIDKQAAITHQENIDSIVEARTKANRAIEVLEQNNIIIQIAGAMGHH